MRVRSNGEEVDAMRRRWQLFRWNGESEEVAGSIRLKHGIIRRIDSLDGERVSVGRLGLFPELNWKRGVERGCWVVCVVVCLGAMSGGV